MGLGLCEGKVWQAMDPLLCLQGPSGTGSCGFQIWQPHILSPVQEKGDLRPPCPETAWSPVTTRDGAQTCPSWDPGHLGSGAEPPGPAKDCGNGN